MENLFFSSTKLGKDSRECFGPPSPQNLLFGASVEPSWFLPADTNLYCFGVNDTLKCLEMGAVEKLIVWEELDVLRLVAKNPATGSMVVIHC